MDNLISKCDSRLESCHEYLENIGRREVAHGIGLVLDDLDLLRQQYDVLLQQHSAAIQSLRQELMNQRVVIDNERKARDDARKLAQLSSTRVDELERAVSLKNNTIGQLHDTIGSKNTSIAKLNKELDREKANTKSAYTQGFKAGQQAAEDAKPRGPQDANEELIERSLQRGHQAYDAQDFGVAKGFLRDAASRVDRLSFDRRDQYDTTRLHYQLAVCDAYSEDIDKAKDSLTTFLSHSNAPSNRDDMLYVAHVQHLLAQVHIGYGSLRQASSYCEQSERTRRQLLHRGSNTRHQTYALRARLLELERKERDADLLRESIPDGSREVLRRAYAQLKPLSKETVKPSQPIAQPAPATELLPVWVMKHKITPTPVQPPPPPSNKPPRIPKPQPPQPPVIDIMLRQSWLSILMLTPPTQAPAISPSLKKALILGDKQTVSSILSKEPQITAPALHIAALFGDIEIAKLLVARGVPVNGTCNAQSEKPGKLVHGVTPMHLAIGAQHSDMVKYLHSVGGSFLAPSVAKGTRASAPPLWLISKRWLDMVGDDTKSVVGVLRVLRELGWRVEAGLNEDGDTMRGLARRNLGGRGELKGAVMEEVGRGV